MAPKASPSSKGEALVHPEVVFKAARRSKPKSGHPRGPLGRLGLQRRVVITGMAVNTVLGDCLDQFLQSLLAGKSGITRWKKFGKLPLYSKVGGDLSEYNIPQRAMLWEGRIPPEVFARLKKIVQRSPWSTRLTALLTLDVWQHANLFDRPLDPSHIATIAAGHNFNQNYAFENYQKFQTEPDFIDPLFSLHTLDSDHAATASELIQSQGPLSTMGGACASGALAIRNALDEIRYHGSDACLVIGPVYDMAPPELQSLCQMGAVSIRHFNQEPSRASRPFDRRREGFVPAHGGAAMVLESLESAQNRGASIYGEILGVAATSDANHLPIPSEAGQIRTLQNIFAQTGVRPEQIDFVSAHATSTPLGDSVEVSALQKVFGPHARRLKINAPKSLLGHTCWSSAIVELVAAVLQINRGILHPSINIEELDPGNDLDVCANVACPIEANYLLKNSFGFGGVNSAILVKKFLAP